MTREEFRDLVNRIQRQLVSLGFEELADQRNYERGETEADRYSDPKALAVGMLAAFDRHLMMIDHRVYESVLSELRTLDLPHLETPFIDFGESGLNPDGITGSFRFSSLHDLRELRGMLSELIGQLRES